MDMQLGIHKHVEKAGLKRQPHLDTYPRVPIQHLSLLPRKVRYLGSSHHTHLPAFFSLRRESSWRAMKFIWIKARFPDVSSLAISFTKQHCSTLRAIEWRKVAHPQDLQHKSQVLTHSIDNKTQQCKVLNVILKPTSKMKRELIPNIALLPFGNCQASVNHSSKSKVSYDAHFTYQCTWKAVFIMCKQNV